MKPRGSGPVADLKTSDKEKKMKHSITLFILLALTVVLSAQTVQAGNFSIPHNLEDQIIIHTYPDLYAHPVDYWWQRNPSERGSWDYFSPVKHVQAPVKLEPIPVAMPRPLPTVFW